MSPLVKLATKPGTSSPALGKYNASTHTHHKVCQLALGDAVCSSLAPHLKSSDRHMTVSAGPDEVMAIGRRGGFSDTSTSMLAVACSHNDTHELSLALHQYPPPREQHNTYWSCQQER